MCSWEFWDDDFPVCMLLQTYVAITQAIKEVQSGGAGAGRVDYQVSSTPTIPLKATVLFCDSAKEAADLY